MLPHLRGVPHLHVNRFLDWQNNNSARASHVFISCVPLPFVEDVNSRQRLSFSFPELRYSLLEFSQLQKKLPRSDELNEMEKARYGLKQRYFTFQ